MSFDFDLAVIGSGPAGQRAAVQAAKLGKKVVLVERERLGGNCLHFGTIPSKTLREAVLLENHKNQNFLTQVMKRKRSVVEAEVAIIRDQLLRNGVKILSGSAEFTDRHSVLVRASDKKRPLRLTAQSIVIATGTKPRTPKEIPFKKDRVMDSDTILALKKVPKTICILGAGVIGCEYVSIFVQMGVKVTLLDRRTDLLRGLDREVVAALASHFKNKQVRFELGADYSDIRSDSSKVSLKINGRRKTFDALLFCMGRTGNTEELSLENAGLKANERGLITVNSHFQTAVPNIYAVGDIIGSPALAAAAYEQGRLAACHALQNEDVCFPSLFPYGVYTIPEISSVGEEEATLVEKKIPFVVGRAQYRELARGKILGDEYGFVKLLFHKETHALLGVHILGTHATELIHIGQLALQFKATIEALTAMVFNYPTLAEAYKVACLNAYNQLRSSKPTKE